MGITFNTIGRRLFLSFGILFLNLLLISILGVIFIDTNSKFDTLSKTANSQRVTVINVFKSDLDFLRSAPTKKEFYEQNSKIAWGLPDLGFDLAYRDKILISVKEKNGALFKRLVSENLQSSTDKKRIDSLLENYNITFITIVETLRKRGFKDFGLEGNMRSYAHQLEGDPNVPLNRLLTLRRYEKDFFLRKEEAHKTFSSI